MAGLILSKKKLIAYINEMGGKASKSDSDATLIRKANKLGLGARKAKPQYLGGREMRPRKKTARRRASEASKREENRKAREWRRAFKAQQNPGPDPYRQDILVLDPAGISPAGPFGPFGDMEWMRKAHNPGLPMPGQVVGMGDYLLIDNDPPAPMAENPMGDYLLLDDAPAQKKGNPPGKVMYSIQLGRPDYIEEVKQDTNVGKSVLHLFRSGAYITSFAPTPAQVKKVKAKKGTINITDRQITKARQILSMGA